VIAHNKTLAAQLCNEFREFFPDNAVEYFVSYYDYYQPEAYVPQADLYIEKDSSRNDDIDRLRHAATASLLSRRDTVIVASVSCIYGLGSPEEYEKRLVNLAVGEEHDRDELLRKLIDTQYVRNDTLLGRGRFRVKGDVVEVQPASSETAYRVSLFGDEVEQITHFDPLTGEVYAKLDNLTIFPATQYVTSKPTIEAAMDGLRAELEGQVRLFESEGKMLEAHRIRQRTEYDMEMMKELGFCNGIENYSRPLEGRPPGSPPHTLLDYFPSDFLCFIDESHQTVPQIGGMYEGDRSRKQTLVDFGFRLPSALDNRPLRFDEFLSRIGQTIFVSATPGSYELRNSAVVSEQLIRPTGIVDPIVELRATKNQIDDLLGEIRRRSDVGERVLVTTLTKKMSEDLTDYLLEAGVKARYLHSEIDTLERIQIIRELRLGEYDVLVGVNLLREGLDLPEVSLVAVLDADKEGFLRGKTALVQTIGRAARNVNGRVLLYGDKITEAIRFAVDETDRRRATQLAYNEEHGITPENIIKGVSDIAEFLTLEAPTVPGRRRRGKAKVEGLDQAELEKLAITLEEEMFAAAEELRFEYAAKLRDEIKDLRRELQALTGA
jgi:excinuclease ABC subunit B